MSICFMVISYKQSLYLSGLDKHVLSHLCSHKILSTPPRLHVLVWKVPYNHPSLVSLLQIRLNKKTGIKYLQGTYLSFGSLSLSVKIKLHWRYNNVSIIQMEWLNTMKLQQDQGLVRSGRRRSWFSSEVSCFILLLWCPAPFSVPQPTWHFLELNLNTTQTVRDRAQAFFWSVSVSLLTAQILFLRLITLNI